jgi:CHAD domain-containing protein
MARATHAHVGSRSRSTQRALLQQLDRARRKLGTRPRTPSASQSRIHDARKELKRARATLRLIRDAIGVRAYRCANRRVRDVGRSLSRVRDAKMLVDAAETLRERTKGAARAELAGLARTLRRERERACSELWDATVVRAELRQSLEAVQADARAWPAPTGDALQQGIERIYRKGRKAFARARKDPRDETLHEARKQTKYMSKALEVAEPVSRGRTAKARKGAEQVSDALGADHDFAVLRSKLALRSSSRRALLARIERRREKLQRKAARRARRLYRSKARAFVDDLDIDVGSR